MRRRRLDGVLLLDKPAGVGSNAVLQSAKRLFAAEKAGHAGTLDPLASGLLPLLFGEATKLSQLALDADKEYQAEARLGITTSTGDAEGEVIERRSCHASVGEVRDALARFTGEIAQVPPMYSALKQGGRPLYELARQGREVPRAPRRVRVYALELMRLEGEHLELRVRCSKGTYVRTLVEDIGSALGCGAHLARLRRVAAAHFRIEDAVTLDALQAMNPGARDGWLLPLERLADALPRVVLPQGLEGRFRRGQEVHLDGAPEGRCGVFGTDGRLLGLGECTGPATLRPRRLIHHATG